MNNLQERKQKIAHFYDIESESERDALIAEIVEYAEGQNAEQFAIEVRETFEQKAYSGIGVVYEAVGKEPEKWSEFIFQEYMRAFDAAETAQNPFKILDALEEFSLVEAIKLPSRERLINLISGYLSHQEPAIRYKATWLLGDWILEDNKSEQGNTILKITNLLKDSHWKVRHVAMLTLQDLNRLPKGFSQGIMDRMRVSFFKSFEWE